MRRASKGSSNCHPRDSRLDAAPACVVVRRAQLEVRRLASREIRHEGGESSLASADSNVDDELATQTAVCEAAGVVREVILYMYHPSYGTYGQMLWPSPLKLCRKKDDSCTESPLEPWNVTSLFAHGCLSREPVNVTLGIC